LLALPPEARQNFRRNAERWMRMSPEERNIMRQRENLRRETIKRETETALGESGLHLNPQERAQFESPTFRNAEKWNKRSGIKSKRNGSSNCRR